MAMAPVISTPLLPLPEMTLHAPVQGPPGVVLSVPPTVLLGAPLMYTPEVLVFLFLAAAPATSVPI